MEQGAGGDFVGGQSEIVPEASMQVSCIWCGRLHQVERPLEFHPVCPICTRTYPMGLLEMNGSYPLSHETIDEMVSRTSPGNYALGYMNGTTFMVFYVGRSDSDVKRRRREWVGAPSRYERYAPCAKAGVGISSPAVPPPGRSSGRSRRDRCRQQLHELRVQLRTLRRSSIREGVPQLPRLRGQ